MPQDWKHLKNKDKVESLSLSKLSQSEYSVEIITQKNKLGAHVFISESNNNAIFDLVEEIHRPQVETDYLKLFTLEKISSALGDSSFGSCNISPIYDSIQVALQMNLEDNYEENYSTGADDTPFIQHEGLLEMQSTDKS